MQTENADHSKTPLLLRDFWALALVLILSSTAWAQNSAIPRTLPEKSSPEGRRKAARYLAMNPKPSEEHIRLLASRPNKKSSTAKKAKTSKASAKNKSTKTTRQSPKIKKKVAKK